MAFHSKIFWACLGTVFCWIFFWSGISNPIKKRQPYSNRHLNSLANNVEVVAILPLLPPILLYALLLRFTVDPLQRLLNKGSARRKERREAVILRQVYGHVRRGMATEDLNYVRREKMPDVEMVEVVASDDQIQTVESPLHTIKKKGFPFEVLPAELRIQIYNLLDYGTALRLAGVSRFFYYDRPYNSIDQEQRMSFLFYAESFAHNKGRLACYKCLRGRSRDDFLAEHRTGELGKYGGRESERRCFDCVIETDDIGKPRLWRFRFRRWQTRTFHRSKASLDGFRPNDRVEHDV